MKYKSNGEGKRNSPFITFNLIANYLDGENIINNSPRAFA